jgi:hypothetical protein
MRKLNRHRDDASHLFLVKSQGLQGDATTPVHLLVEGFLGGQHLDDLLDLLRTDDPRQIVVYHDIPIGLYNRLLCRLEHFTSRSPLFRRAARVLMDLVVKTLEQDKR